MDDTDRRTQSLKGQRGEGRGATGSHCPAAFEAEPYSLIISDTTCLPRGRPSPGTGDPKASRTSGHSAHHNTTEVSLYFVSTCLVTTGTQHSVNAAHSWEEKPLGPTAQLGGKPQNLPPWEALGGPGPSGLAQAGSSTVIIWSWRPLRPGVPSSSMAQPPTPPKATALSSQTTAPTWGCCGGRSSVPLGPRPSV